LMVVLHRRGHFRLDARSKRAIPRIVAATIGMGIVLWLLDEACQPFYVGHFLVRSAVLIAVIAVGALVFFALALALGAVSRHEIKQRLALTRRP
jgi:putative peptidoglycan lipid II flippase